MLINVFLIFLGDLIVYYLEVLLDAANLVEAALDERTFEFLPDLEVEYYGRLTRTLSFLYRGSLNSSKEELERE